MDYQNTPEGKDPHIWRLAQKRVSFKKHLIVYIIVNLFFWVLWFIGQRQVGFSFGGYQLPWPVWTTFGWGIGLAFHYVDAYVNMGNSSIEKEYEKLEQKH